MAEMPKVGTLLGRFQLERELGQGSIGAVYLAQDTLLDTQVALKVISPSLAKTDAFSRLAREVLLARRIAHPGVCRIFDIHEVNQYLFISMDYIEGPTLEDLINKGGVLPIPRAAKLIGHTALALQSAHAQDIIHRGLTPTNIVVRSGDKVSIMDFGQGEARDLAGATGTTTPEETAHYMSPEVLRGDPATEASDIYSLGAILYRAVTGSQPFQGSNAVEVTNAILTGSMVPPHLFNPQVSQALEKFITKSMAVAKDERYKSVLEFKEWLTAVTGEDTGSDEQGENGAFMGQPGIAQGEEEELDPGDGHTQRVVMQETTLLFSDIVAITRFFDKFGDMAGRKRIQKHNELLFPVIQRHRGRVIKTIGDAIMAYFLSPDDGVEAAAEMQQVLEVRNNAISDEDARIFIRIGLHSGPCIIENQDVFGDAVNVASRVCTQADGREILISEITRQQLGRSKKHTIFKSETTLKGKSGDFNLFLVEWEGVELPTSAPPIPDGVPLPVDPLAPPPTTKTSSGQMTQVIAPLGGSASPAGRGLLAKDDGALPDMSDRTLADEQPRELVPDPVPPAAESTGNEAQGLYIPDMENTSDTDTSDMFTALDQPKIPSAILDGGTAVISTRKAQRKPEAVPPAPGRKGLKISLLLGALLVVGVGLALGISMVLEPIDSVDSGVIGDPSGLAKGPGRVEVPLPDPPGVDPVAPDVGPAPVLVDPPPVALVDPDIPSAAGNSKADLKKLRRSMQAAMRKKGIIAGDNKRLDAELRKMKNLLKQGMLKQALETGKYAQTHLRSIKVDQAFIKAKLLRFNRVFDKAGDNPAAAKVVELGQDIMSAFDSGRYVRANSLLNRSFMILKKGH